jgi:hypothetical protein
MKRAIIVAAAALSIGGPAGAQTDSNLAVAPPASRTTGPTVPDTRQLDQSAALPSATSAAPGTGNTTATGSWRASDGLNADPNNPNGAPGPSSIGTSPTR